MSGNTLSSLAALILLSILLLTSFTRHDSRALQALDVNVVWVARSDPGEGHDVAYATCYVDGTLLVFDYEQLPPHSRFWHIFQARIEVRDADNGNLKSYINYDFNLSISAIEDCIVLDGYVYAVGDIYILKISPSLTS